MRLIDADALIRDMEENPPSYGDMGRVISAVNNAPTVEQEPVKPFVGNIWKNSMGRCGHCKAPLPALEGLRSKFCWMCGRKVQWDAPD